MAEDKNVNGAATAEKEEDTEPKEPITGDMLVYDILGKYPEAAYVLMNCGMGCISCPAAMMESLNDACMVHGIDADEVVKYVNYELGLTPADDAAEA